MTQTGCLKDYDDKFQFQVINNFTQMVLCHLTYLAVTEICGELSVVNLDYVEFTAKLKKKSHCSNKFAC